MKRNKVMRAASAILVLAVLTTCIFSGTMAKYIISDYTTDSARVAKFGVVVTASGDLFGSSYTKGATTIQDRQGNASKESVSAVDADTTMLVAPGTANEKGMTFAVYGKPEVTTKTTVDAPEGDGSNANFAQDKPFADSDVWLKEGIYSVMVKVAKADVVLTADNASDYYIFESAAGAKSGTFTQLTNATVASAGDTLYKRVQLTGGTNSAMSGDYYPLVWTVTTNGTAGSPLRGASAIADVKTAVSTALSAANSVPNVLLNNKVNVAWAWDFSTAASDVFTPVAADVTLENWENTSLEDLEDTILGEMIALALGDGDGRFIVAQDLKEVKYAEVNVVADSANKAWVAYAADTAPATAAAANAACLTAAFGARVTVEQVD